MSLIIGEIRAAASEKYRGYDISQEKSKFLLTEMGLPNGLLPLRDIIEVGYIKDTGFVWLIQRTSSTTASRRLGGPCSTASRSPTTSNRRRSSSSLASRPKRC
ncbi:hypothetical protein AAHA92_31124 [Salvia divinorum]|uniref:Uncharacterized protein n=1 Tax=Salvia divinorum TaxID=28513 RepID=A0ABD1FT34_SALDI